MTHLSNLLHRLAHFLDRSAAPCVCRVAAYSAGWKARRDAELRELKQPASPDELDRQLRYEQWLRENAA